MLELFRHWYRFSFAILVWFSSERTVVWLFSLVSAILLFISSMRFLVLLSVQFSKNFNFRSKFGRHSFYVNLFISKVMFFVARVALLHNFCSRPTSAKNTLSSTANQTVSLPLAMRSITLRTSLCKNQTAWEMKIFNPLKILHAVRHSGGCTKMPFLKVAALLLPW